MLKIPKAHSEETPQKDWGTLRKYDYKLKQFVDVPLKGEVSEIAAIFEDFEADEENVGQTLILQDEWGREVPDPRPMVVEVKNLTTEEKIFNQFVIAHNKAAIELQNLPWDFSTPEKAKESFSKILNLDMPEEDAEFISAYEVLPMAEDFPELPPQVEPAPAPAPAPTPEPAPDPLPVPEPPAPNP